MENAMVLLYDLCRLCLEEPGADNIFEPVDWSRDIRKYAGVKVKRADQLPQTICNNCRDILNCTKVLREISTTNNQRLLKLREGEQVSSSYTSTPIHIVTITTGTPSDSDQNESCEQSNVSSSSKDRSFKNRIIFEDDRPNESLRKIEKRHKKKRKLSPCQQGSKTGVSKISIRTDMFNSTETVTSSSSKVNTEPKGSDKYKVENKPSSSKSVKLTLRKSSATSSIDGIAFKTEFNYVCETCSKSYSTHKKLYLHQLTHNRKFICPLDACGKKFATKNDLQKHIRSHTGEKPFKCKLCDQSFSQNVTLKAHRENVHNEIVLSQSQH